MPKKKKLFIDPGYNPKAIIEARSYGIVDLKKYLEKIKKNILVFEEAISKENKEMKRVSDMIAVLEKDIKTAKKFL